MTVGQQTTGANEKTQLSSQKMAITSVNFAKTTYGGAVDISRQDIDWTDPSAWDILVRDLANVYAVQTETAAAAAFKAGSTGTAVTVATNDLKGWSLAIYTAAMHSYQASCMMPDRIWCSLDVCTCGSSRMPAIVTRMPIGRLTRKIQCQPTRSVSTRPCMVTPSFGV